VGTSLRISFDVAGGRRPRLTWAKETSSLSVVVSSLSVSPWFPIHEDFQVPDIGRADDATTRGATPGCIPDLSSTSEEAELEVDLARRSGDNFSV